jgi:hypothetical protein
MITQEQNELIQKYMEDNLTPDEVVLFQQYFKQDKDFAREIKEYTDLKVALKTISKSRINIRQQPKTRSIKPLFWSLAASIVLLIGIGSYFLFRNSQITPNDELFASLYSNPIENKTESYVRSADNTADAQVVEDFTHAINLMEKKHFSEAKTILESISYSPGMEIADHIDWYLLLCMIKLNQIDSAVQLSTEILNSNSIYNTQARIVYNELTK